MAYARALGAVTNPGYLPAIAPSGPQRRVSPEPSIAVPTPAGLRVAPEPHVAVPVPVMPGLRLRVAPEPPIRAPNPLLAAIQRRAPKPRVIAPQTTTYVSPTMGALAVATAPVAPAYGVPPQLTQQLDAAQQQAQAIAAANPSNPLAQQYAALVEQNASDVGGIAADVGSGQLVVGVTPTPGALAAQASKLLGSPVVVLGVVGVLLYIATRSSRR